jgi:hypothetical protein
MGGWGKGGEMTQTLYENMNLKKKDWQETQGEIPQLL